jgi:hypothetical protein
VPKATAAVADHLDRGGVIRIDEISHVELALHASCLADGAGDFLLCEKREV